MTTGADVICLPPKVFKKFYSKEPLAVYCLRIFDRKIFEKLIGGFVFAEAVKLKAKTNTNDIMLSWEMWGEL